MSLEIYLIDFELQTYSFRVCNKNEKRCTLCIFRNTFGKIKMWAFCSSLFAFLFLFHFLRPDTLFAAAAIELCAHNRALHSNVNDSNSVNHVHVLADLQWTNKCIRSLDARSLRARTWAKKEKKTSKWLWKMKRILRFFFLKQAITYNNGIIYCAIRDIVMGLTINKKASLSR